jgi:hypothetical protein
VSAIQLTDIVYCLNFNEDIIGTMKSPNISSALLLRQLPSLRALTRLGGVGPAVAALRDDLVRVIDLHTGKTIKLLRGHRGFVGKQLACPAIF